MSSSDHHYIYIDSEDALRGLIERVEAARRVALDTEADSLHNYYEKVCLIQLAVAGENYIVDPLAGLDLSRFFEALGKKQIILHGADYDLRMLRSSFHFQPEGRIFDTMLAAQLLGHERLGLVALVKHFFDVTLTKHGQKFNWSRRPLPEAKLVYASDDTRYLEPLADYLLEGLRGLGREEWHRETCDALVLSTRKDRVPGDPEDIWRIKGLKSFSRKELASVRSLWHWREKEAQRANTPPFKIMGNALLLELALWVHSHPGQTVDRGPKLPRHCKGKRMDALNKAARVARSLPEDQWPTLKRKKGRQYVSFSKREIAQLDALRSACSRIAAELGITASVLAPRTSLEAIVREKPGIMEEIMRSGRITRWQARLLAPDIQRFLRRGLS